MASRHSKPQEKAGVRGPRIGAGHAGLRARHQGLNGRWRAPQQELHHGEAPIKVSFYLPLWELFLYPKRPILGSMRNFMQDDSTVAGAILLAAGAVGVLLLFVGWLLWRGRQAAARPRRRHRSRSSGEATSYFGPIIGP